MDSRAGLVSNIDLHTTMDNEQINKDILYKCIEEHDLTLLYDFIDNITALPSRQILNVVFQYTGMDVLFNGILKKMLKVKRKSV